MNIKKASDEDISQIVELHTKLYTQDSFSGVMLSYIFVGGNTYIAVLNNKIIGYICVHSLLKSQINELMLSFLQTLNEDTRNQQINQQINSQTNPYFIIPLIGIEPEHRNIFSKLIDRAIKHCLKNNYFTTKYVVVFVRKTDIDIQNLYMSKGFLFTSFIESNMFNYPKDDGILMYKKINMMNRILNK